MHKNYNGVPIPQYKDYVHYMLEDDIEIRGMVLGVDSYIGNSTIITVSLYKGGLHGVKFGSIIKDLSKGQS